VLRRVAFDTVNTSPPNVVLVLMESMSAAKMQRFGNSNNLTPFLDSIANCGYLFENIYSAGIHTHNGIFGSLFSFPAIYARQPMQEVSPTKYHGIASALKNHSYHTIYFTTHDGQFDNIEGFLKANDFDEVITQSDYPSNKVVSALGVPDDYLFDFSMPVLANIHAKNAPFLAVFLTSSDHGPYHIPDYFSPTQTAIKEQIVEYADWSLRKFVNLAAAQPWFSNTIFVFVADHGVPMDAMFEMPLNYHHIPLIIYAPDIIAPAKPIAAIGGQIDVFPTLMGILQLPYNNNTMGIDLLQERRPFMYFCADNKYGVVNDEFFLIVPQNGTEGLYRYRNDDRTNYINDYRELVEVMKNYAQSNLQAAQFVIDRQQQSCH
jgi:phosphoglycerol transferase MdoB-like AlkP superfamily enzyme